MYYTCVFMLLLYCISIHCVIVYSLTDSPDDSEGVIILHCHIGLSMNKPVSLVEHGQQ